MGALCLKPWTSVSATAWNARLRNEFFLSTIISSAEDAIISKNLQGVVTSWNPGAERIFGYTSDEMIGKSISSLDPYRSPG